MPTKYPPKKLDDKVPFKKYRDRDITFEQLIKEAPDYVRWCIDNIGLELDNQCYALLEGKPIPEAETPDEEPAREPEPGDADYVWPEDPPF